MPIQATRTMLRAALSGELDGAEFRTDDVFGFEVPVARAGRRHEAARSAVDLARPRALRPKARELARLFADNFAKRFADVDDAIRARRPDGLMRERADGASRSSRSLPAVAQAYTAHRPRRSATRLSR